MFSKKGNTTHQLLQYDEYYMGVRQYARFVSAHCVGARVGARVGHASSVRRCTDHWCDIWCVIFCHDVSSACSPHLLFPATKEAVTSVLSPACRSARQPGGQVVGQPGNPARRAIYIYICISLSLSLYIHTYIYIYI